MEVQGGGVAGSRHGDHIGIVPRDPTGALPFHCIVGDYRDGRRDHGA